MTFEVLQQLLDTDVLTPDTKTKVAAAVTAIVEEAVTKAEQTTLAKLAEEYTTDRDALVESLDTIVTQQATTRLAQYQAVLESYRDLEVEHATRLVEAKEELVIQSKQDLTALVRKIDSFLDVVVHEEFAELRTELLESKQAALGMKIFEGFKQEFEQMYLHQTGITDRTNQLAQQLKDTREVNRGLKESLSQVTRDREMAKVLLPLDGRPRHVMETILATVATNKLQETYSKFVGSVLHEAVAKPIASLKEGSSEKETQVLADKLDPGKVELKSGNVPESKRKVVVENAAAPRLSEEDKRRLLQSAGLM